MSLNAMSRSNHPNPINFHDLKRWAAHSDLEFAKRRSKRTDKNAQGGVADAEGAQGGVAKAEGADTRGGGRGPQQYKGRGRKFSNFAEFEEFSSSALRF